MKSGDCDLNGTKIFGIFDKFRTESLTSIDPSKEFSDEEIHYEIGKANGINPCMFIPEGALKTLVRKSIKKLLPPCLQCIDDVSSKLLIASNNVMDSNFDNRNDLCKFIRKAMSGIIDDRIKKCEEECLDMFETEQSYINWDHDDFGMIKTAILSNTNMNTTICSMMNVLASNYNFKYYTEANRMPDQEVPLSSCDNTMAGSDDDYEEKIETNPRNKKSSKQKRKKNRNKNILPCNGLTKEESVKITMTRNIVFHYTNIIKKQLKSYIPKIIGKRSNTFSL